MKLVLVLLLLVGFGTAPLTAQTPNSIDGTLQQKLLSDSILKAEGKAETEFCNGFARGVIASRNGTYISLKDAFMDCLITRFQWKAIPAADAWKTEKEH